MDRGNQTGDLLLLAGIVLDYNRLLCVIINGAFTAVFIRGIFVLIEIEIIIVIFIVTDQTAAIAADFRYAEGADATASAPQAFLFASGFGLPKI